MKLATIRNSYFVYIAISAIYGAIGGCLLLLNKINLGQFLGWFFLFVMVAVAISMPIMLQWWKKIDEASQEAHKVAWFWGGGIGFCLSGILAAINVFTSGEVITYIGKFFNIKNAQNYGFELGIFVTFALAGLGYIIHWALWWRKMGA